MIELADGRRLEVVEGGDPEGVPVLVHHGTPGAAVLHPDWEPAAAAEGLRLVTYSRPGYSTSTRHRGRTVADAAGDTAALADSFGFGRFLSLGFSGGGPHVLACAADAEEVRGPIGATLLRHFQQAMSVSVEGWVDDDLAVCRPWGFEFADIRVPVLLLQGRHDAMVPFGHGAWLADRIPGVEARLSDDDGHLSLLTRRMPEVLRWLRERWDAR